MIRNRLGGRLGDSARLGIAMLLVAGLAGCSKSDPLDPIQTDGAIAISRADAAAGGFGSATFYPLALGNTWNYEGFSRLVVLNPDGTPADGGIEIQLAESDRIVGTEVRNGRTYFVREEVLDESPEPYVGRYVTWSRMRQDRAGLFAADVAINEPPALDASAARYSAPKAIVGRPSADISFLEGHGFSKEAAATFAARVERLRDAALGRLSSSNAAGTWQDGELTWLLYPLHIGVEWNIRPDVPWPARVAQVEMIASKLGPLVAYRIETDPLGIPFADGEYVRLFYGRAGFIGYSIHSSFQATDADGNPIGTAIDDETRMLVSTGPNS